MLYAKIVGDVITHYPSSIEYLFSKGVLGSLTPTPQELSDANVVEIQRCISSKPFDGYNYDLQPVKENDVWMQKWVRLPTTDNELLSNTNEIKRRVHRERNIRLSYTDWIVTKSLESGIPIPTEWSNYRQALRDITTQEGYPFNINWPTLPDTLKL